MKSLAFRVVMVLVAGLVCGARARSAESRQLFPPDKVHGDWVEFRAEGFAQPVTGVIFGSQSKVNCGVPLGGVDTGGIDLETSGLLGYCTIFNSHVPRRGPINLPILGLSVGGKTWVLAREQPKKANKLWKEKDQEIAGSENADPVFMNLKLDGVKTTRDIHYWGHYPVADLEFETDAPISVGLRAWAPFLPGDVVSSMIPGEVFEVHLRNSTETRQKGTIAFSFPGPTVKEAQSDQFTREEVKGDFTGVVVNGKLLSYALGAIAEEKVRVGGELGTDGAAWAKIATALPAAPLTQAASSVAIDFSLQAGEMKVLRFVLSWAAPTWNAGGVNWVKPFPVGRRTFTHMYAKYYPSAFETAQLLAKEHEELLQRVLAWQAVVYTDKNLPGWVKDVVINNFHLINEVGMWAQAKPPIGDWCKPEDGLWGLNECPRGCPDIEAAGGGNSYYGSPAILYLFPNLARSSLRGYKAYMFGDGCPPFTWGGLNAGAYPYIDFAMPVRGYQTGQNPSWLVAVAARYLAATGDDSMLSEMYPTLKKTTGFMINLNPVRPYGLISLPSYDPDESFESTPFKGMSSHVGSIRLYHLRTMQRMAERVGDTAFAQQCKGWYDQSLRLMEDYLWAGSYYLQHRDVDSGETANVVMGYQLDGEFMSCFDGLGPGTLPQDRVRTTLATLKRVAMAPWGARVWSEPDGGPVKQFDTGYWTPNGVHAPSALWLADLYMYYGDKEFGLDLARRIMFNMICRQGWAWDMPILYRGDTGAGIYGNDYSQMMAVWVLPAAIEGKDVSGPVKAGGLVQRMIAAAAKMK